MEKNLESEAWWSDAWVRHIETYLDAPPRAGIWLNSRFNLKNKTVLECAGGSCRDSRYLYLQGVKATGSDFDAKTLQYLKQRFPDSAHEVVQLNAFEMNVPDSSIDLVFHNGFWVLFDDKERIKQLLKEQIRVSKEYLVVMVHNSRNQRLVQLFADKVKEDELYDIKFFDTKELAEIISDYRGTFKKVSYEKFGGSFDRLYRLARRYPFLSSFVTWLVPKLYKFQPWSRVERIAMVIKL